MAGVDPIPHTTVEETAETLGRSPASVKRDWTYARAWLFERIRGQA